MVEFLGHPIWLDLINGIRLVIMVLGICAWAAVGWMFGPWLSDTFAKSTSGYVAWMIETSDRMFTPITGRIAVVSILISEVLAVGFALLLTVGLPMTTGYHVLRVLLIVIFLAVGYRLPRFVMQRLWKRRVDKFNEQMVDALSFMSNGLKSGLSLIQCMDMVREELDAPVSDEFGLVLSEQRLGVPLEDALLNLEDRINTEDVQITVTSINILRQSGGNLSETFDTIGFTIRERQKVQGRIRTLTAQGVAQGTIITILPFVLGAVLWMMDPELISRLWTTGLGWGMLVVMMGLQAAGAVMIKKIVTIEV
jgi:tight adherence protein B